MRQAGVDSYKVNVSCETPGTVQEWLIVHTIELPTILYINHLFRFFSQVVEVMVSGVKTQVQVKHFLWNLRQGLYINSP